MLAGKDADGVEVCGGGGEGYSWKNGRSDGGDAVVVGVGVKGTSVDDGGDGAGGESSGKNGWWSVRRLLTVVVVPEFASVEIKMKKKMVNFMVG
ncbi:hypothetical protein Hanom_Chr01g00021741 [Helianthus anomalus]